MAHPLEVKIFFENVLFTQVSSLSVAPSIPIASTS